MREPQEYIEAAWQEYPEDWPQGGITHIPIAQATRAIEAALADAERYKDLLLRAIRNNSTPPSLLLPQSDSDEQQGTTR
jgi:hypothetical protein